MSIFEIYMSFIMTPGVLATIFAFWILAWSYGIERKKFVGIGVCVFFMVISSIAGVL